MDRYKKHREEFASNMENLLADSPFNVSVLADIKLYKTIEKRGFFASFQNARITENDLNQYALRSMTSRKTLEWVIIQYGKDKNFQQRQVGV